MDADAGAARGAARRAPGAGSRPTPCSSTGSRRSSGSRSARRSSSGADGPPLDASLTSRRRTMDRRVFMKSGALALVTMGLSPSFLRRTAFGAELLRGAALGGNARGKTLICLFQRGAADALNVVVPHGDAAYYRAASEHRHCAADAARRRGGRSRSRRLLRAASGARAAQAALGSRACSRRCTPWAARAARARTSTRRTTWRPARPT